MRSKVAGCPSNRYWNSVSKQRRDDEHERDRAPVAAELAQHAHRRGERDAGTHAASARARGTRSSRSSVRGSAQQLVGRRREDPALADQDEVVAAVGLVHHVARDEQRRARVREPVEHAQRSRRSTGSRPTVGSSSTSSSGGRAAPRRARHASARRRKACGPTAARPNEIDEPRATPHATRGASTTVRSSRGFRARSGRRRPTAPASRSHPRPQRRRPRREAEHRARCRSRRAARRRSRGAASSCPTRSARGAPSSALRELEGDARERGVDRGR